MEKFHSWLLEVSHVLKLSSIGMVFSPWISEKIRYNELVPGKKERVETMDLLISQPSSQKIHNVLQKISGREPSPLLQERKVQMLRTRVKKKMKQEWWNKKEQQQEEINERSSYLRFNFQEKESQWKAQRRKGVACYRHQWSSP